MSESVTELLDAVHQGNRSAFDRLFPIVHSELHSIARSLLAVERTGHTLQPTALVNEAYLKLVDQRAARFEHRAQFFGVAAQAMRRILVDHARARGRLKRDGGERVDLDSALLVGEPDLDLLELDEAMTDLAAVNADAARIVELRYFAGLTIAETASTLGVSDSTVESGWRYARAWLYRRLKERDGPAGVPRADRS